MKILISGTPGTGKTSIAKELANRLKLKYISINAFAENNNLIESIDKERDCMIIDEDKLAEAVEKEDNCIIDGHLAHFCNGDLTIILRTNPETLEKRLKIRKWSNKKILENIEAEILGNCLIESVMPGKTIEFDTTSKTTDESVSELEKIIKTKKYAKYKPGRINWTEYLEIYAKKRNQYINV